MTKERLAELRATVAYHDRLHGPDGDCGESACFILINDLRALLRMIDPAKEPK